MKVVVIGAGASGIIASLVASKSNEVILLERNDKVGKKILLTGNGRCNYWNSEISLDKYNASDYDKLTSILANKNTILSYLTSLGIYPKVRNGYYYPNSNQASSVQEILCKELEKNNVNIMYNCKVENIIKKDNSFIIKSNLNDIECDKVIVACGLKSAPKTGSDGNMIEILKKYHTVNEVLPSLVPLEINANFLKDWDNVRVDAKVSLYVDNTFVKEEIGELQLTNYGISGIPTFNISSHASRSLFENKKVTVKINFLPDVDVYKILDDRSKMLPNHTIEELLESILPYQLIFTLLKISHIKREDKYDELSLEQKKLLIKNISELEVDVCGTLDFDRSQVSTGGIPLSEINITTMESNNIKGMYLVGELLDVDGICGGYNLAFSFITGYLAGLGVNND